MADKGYDSYANHKTVLDRGAVPIIPLRRMPGGKLHKGIYTDEGTPTCVGNVPMEYVRSDPTQGHLYKCQAGGCHLQARKGVLNCQDQHWEDHKAHNNPRLFGTIRRDSAEWKELYSLRQTVERLFKSLKQARSLDSHCQRGLKRVGLHAAMSMLSYQATMLYRVRNHQNRLGKMAGSEGRLSRTSTRGTPIFLEGGFHNLLALFKLTAWTIKCRH